MLVASTIAVTSSVDGEQLNPAHHVLASAPEHDDAVGDREERRRDREERRRDRG